MSKEELIEQIAQEIWDCLAWTDLDHRNRMWCATEIFNMTERWLVEHV